MTWKSAAMLMLLAVGMPFIILWLVGEDVYWATVVKLRKARSPRP